MVRRSESDRVRQVTDSGLETLKPHEREIFAVHAANGEADRDIELTLKSTVPDTDASPRHTDDLKPINFKWLAEPLWPPGNLADLPSCGERRASRSPPAENIPTPMDSEGLLATRRVAKKLGRFFCSRFVNQLTLVGGRTALTLA